MLRPLAIAALLASTLAWPALAQTVARHTLPAATLTFPRDSAYVTVPFEIERNQIVVRARLGNSGPLRCFLDSGAGGTVMFSDSTVRLLGWQPAQEARMMGAGGKGVVHGMLYQDATISLGKLAISNLMLVTAPDSVYWGSPLYGLLVIGRDLFQRSIVEIDWDAKRVRIHDPARFKYTGKGATLPLTIGPSGHAYVDARVALQPDSVFDVRLVLDTGASHYLWLEPKTDPRIQLPADAKRERLGTGASGEIYGAKGTAASLEIGGVTFHDVPVNFPDDSFAIAPEAGRKGNVGSGLLSRFRVFLDFAGKRVILEPGPHVNDPLVRLPDLPR
jgi:predicted aspartyl protease